MEDALGAALFSDTASLVWVLDAEARVYACNALATAFFQSGDQSAPEYLHHAIAPRVCQELIQHVEDVVKCGEPRTVRAVIRGAVFFTTLRPFANERPDALVLLVCTPLHELSGLNGALHERSAVELKAKDLGPLERLTSRELEVLRLIGEGLTIRQIADRLHRGVKTVESHRTALGRKLDARNRIQLARIAILAGLSKPTSPDRARP